MATSTLEHPLSLRRASPATLGGLYVLLVTIVIAAAARAGWAAELAAVADWVPKVMVVALGGWIWRSSRYQYRLRQAWGLIAAAYFVLLLTEVGGRVAGVLEAGSGVRRSIGVAYVLVPPLLLMALLRMQRVFRSRTDTAVFVLDALVVMLGTAVALWALLLQPVLPEPSSAPELSQTLLALVYPVGDLVLLFGMATVLVRRPVGLARQVLLWLTLALLFGLIGDLIYTRGALSNGAAGAGILVNWFWLVSPWCLIVAGQYQLLSPALPEPDLRGRDALGSWLPFAATLLAASMLVTEALRAQDLGGLIVKSLAAALFLVVLARLAMAKRLALRLVRERAERESEIKRDALLEHSADAILILDGDRRLRYANPGFHRMVGRTPRIGEPLAPLVHEEDWSRLLAMLQRADGAPGHRSRLRLVGMSGNPVVEVALSTFDSDEGEDHAIINLRDVTEQAALEAQLERHLLRDPLTDLPNRALFRDRVGQALRRARGTDGTVAVLLADLDRFKVINDTEGHAFGDLVLREAAERLAAVAPGSTTVARAADDEFALLLEGELTVEAVTRAAEAINATFAAPFAIEGKSVVVTASIGIAGPTRTDSAEELIRKADVAMNQAKNAGRNQAMAFEAKIDRALGSRAAMLSGLRQAIASRRIDVAFQPIYDVVDNRVHGLEALARWVCPDQGRIAPGVFIAVAEDGGLMLELGALIFDRAIEHAQRIDRDFTLAVNISPQQLADHGFSGLILNGLKAAGWPPERLLLEITESVLAEDRRVVRRNLQYLRDAGVRVAIDDFGTGYSSLSQLHDVPVDVLKIDRRFVDQIETTAGTETVRAIIAIGRALELDIVAEGVETEEQLAILKELGCRYIQGFLFGQPLFESDLKRLSTRPA